MQPLRAIVVGLLAAWLTGCDSQPTSVEQASAQARKHLQSLGAAGLLGEARTALQVASVRPVKPVATRWSSAGQPFWWAELKTPSGEAAGYLAWEGNGRRELLDFSLEGLMECEGAAAKALAGVPPIQQFPIKGADGQPVASGCVPTAGGSLMAYWSNRGTFDWQADDSHEGLVRRLRDRLPMSVLADAEGYTDGKMALAGAFPDALVAGLRADAAQYRIPVDIRVVSYSDQSLRTEISEGRPALLMCNVLVPRKPELSWGHAVVAVGYAEVGGKSFVGVIDNFHVSRQPGTVRWIAADRCSHLVLVRPAK
ncbi:MAG: hypothetical protein RLZ70_1448 [Verrucomicrobiota bacterium]|jgi:hypothetical protein